MKKLVMLVMLALSVMMCSVQKEEKNDSKAAEGQLPKKVVIGLDDTFAPMGFKNEKGELVGFDIDLARYVAKKLNMEVEFKPINWDSKIMDLNSGNIDLIWNGLTITPERAQQTEMSKPYLANSQVIITRVDSNIKSKADLKGKVVGVQTQSSGEEKVKKLDNYIAKEMNFKGVFAVTSQTYTRKIDSKILFLLSNIAQSAHKFSNDLRLLQHLKEIEEPFGKSQIGSSAMPYKRNPMKSERIGALSNFVISNVMNPSITFATQWFERTLDDSANKRLSISQGFLAVDGILNLYANIVDGMVVYEKVIEKHLMAELPFMASENIMMNQVKKGGDRQELHERIRELSQIAGKNVKEKGLENNLLELIEKDDFFDISKDELNEVLNPMKYIGRCPSQVDEFIENEVNPILEENINMIENIKEVEV